MVSPIDPAPDFLSLLSRDLDTAASAGEALRRMGLAGTAVTDARNDLAWTRTAITLIRQTRPDMLLLLMVAGSALGLLSPDWGLPDSVTNGYKVTEIDVQLRFLLHSRNQPYILVADLVRTDEDAYHITIFSKPLNLIYTEFELLRYLM